MDLGVEGSRVARFAVRAKREPEHSTISPYDFSIFFLQTSSSFCFSLELDLSVQESDYNRRKLKKLRGSRTVAG